MNLKSNQPRGNIRSVGKTYIIPILLVFIATQNIVFFGLYFYEGAESIERNTFSKRNSIEPIDLIYNNEDDDKEERCTSNGEVCLYRNICYDLNTELWVTQNDLGEQPLLNNMGLTNKDSIPEGNHLNVFHYSCNEKFNPVKITTNFTSKPYDDQSVMKVQGTTYKVCSWTNHFGHILANLVVPTFHALDKIRIGDLSLVKFLVDERNTRGKRQNLALRVFDFFSKNMNKDKVISFKDLKEEGRSKNHTSICFEKLVVGMYHDVAIHQVMASTSKTAFQREIGMLQPMRNHLSNLYPASENAMKEALNTTLMSTPTRPNNPPDCTITLLERKTTLRAFTNLDETLQIIHTIFDPTTWNLQRVAFDDAPLESQYLTMQSTIMFITVSGTGSHMSIFLPDGGVDLEIKYWHTSRVNDLFCGVSPNLHCLTTDAVGANGTDFLAAKDGDVTIDVVDFKNVLQKAYHQLAMRCQIAMNEKVTS